MRKQLHVIVTLCIPLFTLNAVLNWAPVKINKDLFALQLQHEIKY